LNLVDLVFPKICFGCKNLNYYLCPDCLKSKVRVNLFTKCLICNRSVKVGLIHSDCKEKTELDGLIYVAQFEGIVKDAIHSGKFNDTREVFKDLGKIMAEYILKFYNFRNYIVSFIPQHRTSKLERGFNQAEILAEIVSRNANLKFLNSLNKVKKTGHQSLSDSSTRAFNLKDAFVVANSNVSNQKILLIDDICTTGSTLNECAKALKASGAVEVVGFCFAKSGEVFS